MRAARLTAFALLSLLACDGTDSARPAGDRGERAPVEAVTAEPAPPDPTEACPELETPWGAASGERVTRAAMGDERWPVNVDTVCLYCVAPDARLMHAAGVTYGLNGPALRGARYPNADLIWRVHPEFEGARMSIEPIVEAAAALCDAR